MNSNKPSSASEHPAGGLLPDQLLVSNDALLSSDALLPGEDVEPSRRAFLQFAGYGVAASMLAGCSRGPVRQVVPYLTAPTDIISGKSYWLATTCGGCSAACGVLAKCRDGRPIKVEGNRLHEISQGGLCAVGQGEVLSLYDSKRIETPLLEEGQVTWDAVDARVVQALDAAIAGGKQVRLLTGTEHGPSTRAAINTFLAKYPAARHVTYEGLSVSALLDAHAQTHDRRVLPTFHFDKARVIVSFDADFLGTWISPVAFAADYAKGRRPDKPEGWMSKHIQLESRLSLSGSAADQRVRIQPGETVPLLATLCELLEVHAKREPRLSGWASEETAIAQELADELWGARGQSLIVCGTNSVEAQKLTAYANELLGNYGRTLDVATPSMQRMENDSDLATLRTDLDAGRVDVLIVSGKNPAYDLPAGFGEALSKAGMLIAHTPNRDETARLAKLALPLPHPLESWGDGEPRAGHFSLMQPTIPALRDSRSLRLMLSKWSGDDADDRELLRRTWREVIHPQFKGSGTFNEFFNKSLHDGYVGQRRLYSTPEFRFAAIDNPVRENLPEGLSLVLYPKVGLLDGRTAHNPWLQELPDPISKVTWDNYACLSPLRAKELGVETGDVLRIRGQAEGQLLELPVLVQRGQHDDVVAVALGYGRLGTDRFANVGPQWIEGTQTVERGGTIGVNVAPWIHHAGGTLRYEIAGVKIERADGHVDLARTQDYHSLAIPEHLAPERGKVREAVRTASFAAYSEDPSHAFHAAHHGSTDLWPEDHKPENHHWGMSVDLASCIGCSACSVSCQAENNVPVVGKDEVLRHREMHWMRIDRYFEGEGDEVTAHYQPMFCQQCDNAPCEGVCPVLATVHSTEGLNQQVYNRCVGTRYCANTCPYKVRRFNWFNYPHEDHLENQSLNPDVTVRTRGVMEKCSFCYQRIHDAKAEAKRTGKPLADGDIQVACQQSCPTQAIVFGDLADPESRVSKLSQRQRSYRVLEELNVKPSVRYLGRIRNQSEEGHEGEHHG